jgi:hypothetical protein
MKTKLIFLCAVLSFGLVMFSCHSSNEKPKNNDIQSEKAIEVKVEPEELMPYLGVWSGPENYPLIELAYKNEIINIRECYGLEPEDGTEYQAKIKNGIVVAIGEEKDFYKGTFPAFELAGDTMGYNSGIGPLTLLKSSLTMPDVEYFPSMNND